MLPKYWFQTALPKLQPKILISACLLGETVRYDGGDCAHHLNEESKMLIQSWQQQGLLLALCPEVTGGLSVPRPAAEIIEGQVKTQAGEDVSEAFQLGAKTALNLCLKYDIHHAILKQGSPSCGNSQVNDGSFKKQKIEGQGITAALLMQHGVRVFNEHEVSRIAGLI